MAKPCKCSNTNQRSILMLSRIDSLRIYGGCSEANLQRIHAPYHVAVQRCIYAFPTTSVKNILVEVPTIMERKTLNTQLLLSTLLRRSRALLFFQQGLFPIRYPRQSACNLVYTYLASHWKLIFTDGSKIDMATFFTVADRYENLIKSGLLHGVHINILRRSNGFVKYAISNPIQKGNKLSQQRSILKLFYDLKK